ncbi:tetratricopeptide repeat protein [Fibrobacter sp. UWP2]|jgi:tetratricopeptide (TPR) repeat protein|uniref:tetratricopeptide repeat protein n=1 Tax=Fibrobacter sp. UWP2 TaxID=1896216 RepID=UPI000920967C|nr:tetratricopeptide repeat protein [Fibrobacter sp. UWP2]SHI66313.1 Tetratricopeptide repeat-containing protein [Fibrobacter sp. UWP2]
MKKIILAMAMICTLVGTSFAADPCKEKTNEAKKLLAKCKSMEKGSAKYKECANSYKVAKNAAAQACRSGGLDEKGMQDAIAQWEKQVNNCKGKQNKRCASALQQLGHYQFQLEEKLFLDKQAQYEEDVAWCADRDNKPEKCANIDQFPKADHQKSLGYFLEYIDKYPKEDKTPVVLYQAAAVQEASGEDDKAFHLRDRLVRNFPDNGLVPKAWLRIAEYHFMNRKFRDAISAYKKVTGFENLTGKEAALAMYHLAESYYNIAEYETAAVKYYDYIIGADKGKYPNDLRAEAMDFMAASFSDLEGGGVAEAEAFLKDKKVPFKDSVYYRIGMKNKDHDRNEEAVQSFKRLMSINPDYIDAPLADIAMIEILIIQQKFEEAQQHRYVVVKRYDRSSSWYKKNQKYPESVKNAETAIRGAMLDIPQYHHARAAKLTKEGDLEAGKKQYAEAIKAYEAFLKRYAKEPTWDEYKVHINLALVYQEMGQHANAAKMFNWIVDTDTTRYGRRPMGSEALLKKEEAAYNAVLMMDQAREDAKKKKAGDDAVKAYNLPETKAYFAQVDKYMKKYGENKEAAELAYNAAIVHYDAKQYKTAVTVLRELRQKYPNHQYILLISRMLAQSLLESDQLDEALTEFEWLYKQYHDVKATKNDSMAKEIEKAIAAVLFQKAEKAVKNQRYEEGAVAYLALVKRYPLVSFADKAVFEAGVAYENAKQHDKAAETFMILPKSYASSSLTIKGILRAASNYKKGGKPQQAATTFLFITNNFPQDSMAFQAIGFAAQTYDSIPDKKNAAVTFELAYKRYPKHEKTPAFLYSACLSYDEAKMTDEAIRCSKDLVRDYPKSTYALDAAFSIPVAYGNAKKWDLAAQEYHFFIKNYGNDDKEKLIAAYIGAARAYMELKEEEKAVEDYRKTLEAYDKYGLQIKNADPGVPAEAAFFLGEYEYHKMEPIVIKGKEKDKAKVIKQLVEILQKAMSQYSKSATYASEKWTFRATNKMGMLFVTMAAKIREQELNGKKEEEKFAERIGIVQQLPSYYEQARPIFQKNIDLARDQGFYNKDVVEAEEGYIEMYYQGCAVFVEVADAFANSPLPDSAAIVKEYVEYEGAVKEDAIEMAHEDLEAYREELNTRSEGAKQLAIPQCATGIKASAHYGIDNQWTAKLFELLKSLDENNETLNTKIEKFDPSTLFADPSYFKTKARLEQISKSEVMTPEEQINTYRDIIKDAKAENEKLKAELAELKKQMEPAPSTSMGGMDDASMDASEPAPAPAAPAKKASGKKKGKKR